MLTLRRHACSRQMKKILLNLITVLLSIGCSNEKKDAAVVNVNPQEISYSQLDITENFGDNLKLNSDDWIKTSPLNAMSDDPESSGLPPLNANENTVYENAKKLSSLREQMEIPSDGVYCPVCHIANIDIEKLHSPCPMCNRQLLKFGWD